MRYLFITLLILAMALFACKKNVPENRVAQTPQSENITKSIAQPIIVSINNAAVLSQYSNHKDFIDNDQGGAIKLVFTTNTTIQDFWFIEIGHNEEPFYLTLENVLYKDTLSSEIPIAITMTELSRIPQRGISYIDENDNRRFFYISEDGAENGVFNLSEFNPKN